jgi:hypothetical protein
MSRMYVLAVLLALTISGTALAQAPSGAPKTISYSILDLELFPRPIAKETILRIDAGQQELKLTDAQKKQQSTIIADRTESMRKAREEYDNSEILDAARNAIFADADAALEGTLEPKQRNRLDQVVLQVQGPLAFERREVRRRLRVTDDQVNCRSMEEGVEKPRLVFIALESQGDTECRGDPQVSRWTGVPIEEAEDPAHHACEPDRHDGSNRRGVERIPALELPEDARRAVRSGEGPASCR